MKKITLLLYFAALASVYAKDFAFVVGGGEEDRMYMFNPFARNWTMGLEKLGWNVEVFFGDEYGSLPKVKKDQRSFDMSSVLDRLKRLEGEVQAGDNILFILATHGTRCSRFSLDTFEDELNDEQVVYTAKLTSPTQPLFFQLLTIDKKTGENGKLIFINNSCYSGASIREFHHSDACALSTSGEDQLGYVPNYLDWMAFQLAGNDAVTSRDDNGSNLYYYSNEDLGTYALGELLSMSLPADLSTEAVYTHGFNLNDLNVMDHKLFIDRFMKMFPSEFVRAGELNAFREVATADHLSRIQRRYTDDQKEMMASLAKNRSFFEPFKLEVSLFMLDEFKRDPIRSKIPEEELKSLLVSIEGFQSPSKYYYKLIERMALWMLMNVKMADWTSHHLGQNGDMEKLIDASMPFFPGSRHFHYAESFKKIIPLLNDDNLATMKRMIMNHSDRIMKDVRTVKSANNSFIEPTYLGSARNRLLSRALINTTSSCARFNLKRN